MAFLVQLGQKKSETLKGNNIKGFTFKMLFSNNFGEIVAPDQQYFDWSQISVKGILYRKKDNIVVFQDTLAALAQESAFFTNQWANTLAVAMDSVATPWNIPVGAAAGGITPYMCDASIDFSIINLRTWGKIEDQFLIEVNVPTAVLLNNTIVDSSSVQLQVDPVEGIGLEFVTPRIETETIDPGQSRFSYYPGDNCLSVFYCQKNALTAAASPISQFSLGSDKMDLTDTLPELIAKRRKMFTSASINSTLDADYRAASFMLFSSEQELQGAKLDFTLDPTLVTSGNNVLVARTFILDPEVYNYSMKKQAEYRQINLQKAANKG